MSDTKELQEQKRVRHIQEMKERLQHHLGNPSPHFWANLKARNGKKNFWNIFFSWRGWTNNRSSACLKAAAFYCLRLRA